MLLIPSRLIKIRSIAPMRSAIIRRKHPRDQYAKIACFNNATKQAILSVIVNVSKVLIFHCLSSLYNAKLDLDAAKRAFTGNPMIRRLSFRGIVTRLSVGLPAGEFSVPPEPTAGHFGSNEKIAPFSAELVYNQPM